MLLLLIADIIKLQIKPITLQVGVIINSSIYSSLFLTREVSIAGIHPILDG